MSQKTKIVVGILAALLLLCVGTGIVGIVAIWRASRSAMEQMLITDPSEVVIVARSIAEYDLPPGYHEQMVFDFLFYKMLAIAPTEASPADSTRPVFMLAQMTSVAALEEMDEEEFRRQVQASVQQRFQRRDFNVQLVGEEEVMIGEQEVTLLVYEGVDGEGDELRVVVSDLFQVKERPTMLVVIGSPRAWDEVQVNAFVQSIH